MIKKIGRYIFIYLLALGIMIGLLILVAQIPKDDIRDNVMESAQYYCDTGLFIRQVEGVNASAIDHYADSILVGIAYQYDENNHITKTISYDVSGGRLSNAISYYQLHKCYENGNIAESHLYIHGKELTSIDKYQYDENGNKIRCDTYSPEGEFEFYTIYEYGEEGNLIYETLFDEDGYRLRHIEYNEYGDMIKKITYQDYEGIL